MGNAVSYLLSTNFLLVLLNSYCLVPALFAAIDFSFQLLLEKFEEVVKQNKFVILNTHWSVCEHVYPQPRFVKLLAFFSHLFTVGLSLDSPRHSICRILVSLINSCFIGSRKLCWEAESTLQTSKQIRSQTRYLAQIHISKNIYTHNSKLNLAQIHISKKNMHTRLKATLNKLNKCWFSRAKTNKIQLNRL
jgi:hypothetical protein